MKHRVTTGIGRQKYFIGLIYLASATQVSLAPRTGASAPKTEWKPAYIVGSIDRAAIPEASGIAASSVIEDRLYHINDRGSAPSFIITDRKGQNPKSIGLNLTEWVDTEEIAVGPCPASGSCLYIADIGDNKFKRDSIFIHLVQDEKIIAQDTSPLKTLTLRYDDGKPHNAESFAIHPGRIAFILTKENPAQLFRFNLDEINGYQEIMLKKVGTIDLNPFLEGKGRPKKNLPTSMAIRPDGKQIVILTSSQGLSMDMDLKNLPDSYPLDINSYIEENQIPTTRLPMIELPQSEGITYINGGKSVLYSSEIAETGGESAPLVQIDSLAGAPW